MTHTATLTQNLPSEQTMRQAIAARDAHYDGVFVYGVITTGVYCLPSCRSRPARAENLRFFAHSAAAQSAGLRPCKRCRPGASDSRGSGRILALARYIEGHADQPLSLAALSKRAHLSPAHLQRTFKAVLGVSPKEYQDAARLRRLKGGLKAGMSVLDAATDAGFQSTSRIYGQASRNLGMSPSSYRSGGAGEVRRARCLDRSFRSTHFGERASARSAAGPARDGVSDPRLAIPAPGAGRAATELCGSCAGGGFTKGISCGCIRLRRQSDCRAGSVSPRTARRWGHGRLPMGNRAQACADRSGKSAGHLMSALDSQTLREALDQEGFAITAPLLDANEKPAPLPCFCATAPVTTTAFTRITTAPWV